MREVRVGPGGKRKCAGQCGEWLDTSCFGKDSYAKSGLRSSCRACCLKQWESWIARNPEKYAAKLARQRDWDKNSGGRIRRVYGLSLRQYREMLDSQGGACASCGSSDVSRQNGGRLHVDHCHKDKTIRGLLCNGCNASAGLLGECPLRAL